MQIEHSRITSEVWWRKWDVVGLLVLKDSKDMWELELEEYVQWGAGQMGHTLGRASEGGKPRACLEQCCKSILASHRLYVGKLLEVKLEK